MKIHEESRTLAEFYPAAPTRQKLHYEFAHRFLLWYVHDNPFNFILHDGVDPTRFIQARWAMMEQLMGLQKSGVTPDGGMVFRRVTDLAAWAQDVAGYPAVFVQMPAPEFPGCAFFVAAMLLAPADAFRAVEDNVRQHVAGAGPYPSEPALAPFRTARARVFTLERSINYAGEQALQVGRLCEWTAAKEHRNSGLAVPVTRDAFASAVSSALQQDGQIPAVATSSPDGITITAPPAPPKPPPAPTEPAKKGPKRPLLYMFQHVALREAAFENHPQLIRELADPDPTLPLLHFRSKALLHCIRAGYQHIDPMNEEAMLGAMESKKDLFKGVAIHPHRQAGHTAYVISMPAPESPPEAHFVAIVHRDDEPKEYMGPSPSTRYFTLEASDLGLPLFCEWLRDGTRRNHGAGLVPEMTVLVEAVFARVAAGQKGGQ